MNKHVYNHSTVVNGSGINSLLYCFRTETPLLMQRFQGPFYFEETEGDFSFIGLGEGSTRTEALWNRIYFLLCMSGLIINPLPTQNIRIEDNEIIYVTTGNRKVIVEIDEMIEFEKEQEKYLVYDWFDVKSGAKHEFDHLEDSKNFFVQFLRFYPSMRRNVRRAKDVVAISNLTKDDLVDFNYSEGMARLKTIKMMKEAGIRGKSNGISKAGYKLHYAVKLEHSHREAFPKMEYKMSVEEILNLEQSKDPMKFLEIRSLIM